MGAWLRCVVAGAVVVGADGVASAGVSIGVVSAAVDAGEPECDLNGDRYADLAIGAPLENHNGSSDAGAVQVLYGTVTGLAADGSQWWDQASAGVAGDPERFDSFGSSLACADFDGDGFADLVIGVPSEDLGGIDNAGAVQVLYGSATGVTADGSQWWDQGSAGVAGDRESDRFGSLLAVGDFDGDGFADLVVGVPNEDLGDLVDAGAVQVVYGSATGLTATGSQWWDQGSPDIAGTPEAYDSFGSSLGIGDFDGDGFTDLAIGVWGEDLGGTAYAGAIQVLYGSATGLTADGSQWWDQDSPGIAGTPEWLDGFGSSLGVGDFDRDGFADLAIGVHGEDLDAIEGAGAVQVLYGSATGLTAEGGQWWDQSTPGIAGAPEIFDSFGSSLEAGDFDGDGFADLAIGIPDEDLGGTRDAGALQVLYGSTSGLAADRSQWWDQSTPAIAGAPETGDQLGWSLSRADFDGDGFTDLAIGVPAEDLGGTEDVGAAQVLYGSATGLTADRSQWWDQSSPGIAGAPETGDQFGVV